VEQISPCITARRGGCVLTKWREATEADADGVVFVVFSIGGRAQSGSFATFFFARPALLAVMQGGEFA